MNRKKNSAKGVLFVILLLMTFGMLVLTGFIKGWFASAASGDLILSSDAGSVYLKRFGICFQPSEGTCIRKGDLLMTGKEASAVLENDKNVMKLRPETRLNLIWQEGKKVLELQSGSLFLWGCDESSISVRIREKEYILSRAAAYLSAEAECEPVTLFAGSCDEISDSLPDISTISLETLRDLEEYSDQTVLCWSKEDLIREKAQRERIRQKELQEKLSAQTEYSEDTKVCSIRITCTSVLSHMEQLNQEKKPYIPEDGEILQRTEVNFEDGETVLDVLERVCTAGEIPLEYNYTPAYKSYYMEGINHLYEFDCGPASGWTYTVNGKYPNYGCSSYVLSEGDEIEWIYTCDYTTSDIDKKE